MLCAVLVSASQERCGGVKEVTESAKYNYQGGGAMLYAERLKRLGISAKGMDIGNTEPLFTKSHMTRIRLGTMKLVGQFKTNKGSTSPHLVVDFVNFTE